MSEPDLSFQQLARRLRLGDLAHAEPSADLWQRIASAHQQGVRRARARRIAWWGGGGAVVLAALIGAAAGWSGRAQTPAEVDWQGRAQALELQLRALDAATPAQASNALAGAARNELLLVDVALQTAYDDGAEQQQVSALWKRRSELLSALVTARRQNMEISRI